jgi:histidinol phosphatase-like enzyme (inositol monophosphatase family)
MLADADLAAFEAFALELQAAARDVILPLFRADHGLEDKGAAKGQGFDPVTLADRGAEAAIRRLIAQRFPDHGVIGEEYGEDRPDTDHVWVLDPVDGTRAFIAGIPLWTTLIALRHQNRPVVGAIGQGYLDEVYIGSARGSRLITVGHEQPLRVRSCPALSEAILGVTDPDPRAYFTPPEAAAFDRLRQASRLTRLGGDAYFFALVALGTMDMVVEGGALKAWDVEAAIPLIQGAGGVVSDWRGRPLGQNGGQVIAAGDARLRDQAVALLAVNAPHPTLSPKGERGA